MHRTTEPRWKIVERLSRSLTLSDALFNYIDDIAGNPELLAESRSRLKQQFGLTQDEIDSIRAESSHVHQSEWQIGGKY